MDQRISIVTLGTDNMDRAVAFWEAMGWPRKMRKWEAIAMFQCGTMALAIYPFDKLAEDCGMQDRGPGFGGFTLAHNVGSKAEVDELLARAVANGATLQNPPMMPSGAATPAISAIPTATLGKWSTTRSCCRDRMGL